MASLGPSPTPHFPLWPPSGSSWSPAWWLCCCGRQVRPQHPSPRWASEQPLPRCPPSVWTVAEPTPVTLPIKVHVKHRPSEQEAEKAWGARVVEPPEKDDQLVGLLPVPKPKLLTAEKSPGIKASVETEDILGHVLSPQQGPEPDHDSLHHPPPEEDQGEEGPRLWVMPNRQVLRGPEEDQDHIYHPQ
ncbi:PREDICTED: proline-rich acidic protein 1 isoform X4 [Cercocebus atys]|uniref:proline-rich acidic protein 1 isoform X4 n=1 Tax=Cercocebus atys TaxID=9531 RepID=UPI0005F3D1B0|nr:PREDICTED: proline-rich acidic protein 1 isoform X4 [Cercocebus atys]